MNISALFINRPVATILLTLSLALAGFTAFMMLPVSPLPQIDFATIVVTANLPGASPETMAATVATPLERTLGRIPGIEEMTSQSSLGSTFIALQFDLDKDSDGAAREVQAAINAARAILPTMPTNPTYKKRNPADAPIMIVALTSDTMPLGDLYDLASSVISQKISQLYGIGQVQVSGSSLPAVRVSLEPGPLLETGLPLDTLRSTIANSNANMPKGFIDNGAIQWTITANDTMHSAEEFSQIIIKHTTLGGSLRLSDVAAVYDGVENTYNAGYVNGCEGILLIIYKEPGANIIDTVERVKENLPLLRAWTPENVEFSILMDRSPSIKISLHDVEITMVIAMLLVIFVVYLFLRNSRATFIPAISIPVSLLGTFAVMYLCGYSLNHLSLMALTIATGFVVDDAIVVTENIVRHMENGSSTREAALQGSKEVAFTVMSISFSLVAIFIPILGMGGLIGRMFKEFSVTLATAVLVSLLISLMTTPMLCALLLRPEHLEFLPPAQKIRPPRGDNLTQWRSLFSIATRIWRYMMHLWVELLDKLHEGYARTLIIVLRHKKTTFTCLLLVICLNVYLYIIVPKGMFPEQDNGMMFGTIRADQSISFQAMLPKLHQLMDIVRAHEDVVSIGGFTGGGQKNAAFAFITLKPKKDRKKSLGQIMEELRERLDQVPGATLTLMSAQDLRIGGRRAQATYQYTLQSDSLPALREWSSKVTERFKNIPGLIDVKSDQENKGLQTTVFSNRSTLSRLGITQKQVDSSLGWAFGQKFASTIYAGANQYRVVMTYSDPYLEDPDSLNLLYVPKSAPLSAAMATQTTGLQGNTASSTDRATNLSNTLIPLTSFARFIPTLTPLSVSHQSQNVASTISFNLLPEYSFSQVQQDIDEAVFELGLPNSVRGGFQGTAKAFSDSIKSQPMLILAALVTLYIVLGILYESFIHPLTILSTLPSAGVGAILALMLFKTDFSIIAFIGVLLLGGIVKKNAIMMIDFALEAKRVEKLPPEQAIYNACLLRFRPIMMTTMAAIFGAIPLIIGSGEGAEIRTPLGITIVGGLIVSQLLTLYTTPVVYLYLDRFTRPTKEPLQ